MKEMKTIWKFNSESLNVDFISSYSQPLEGMQPAVS